MTSGKVNYCRLCLLPKLPEGEEAGHTSFLYATLHCQCQRKKPEAADFYYAATGGGAHHEKKSREMCLLCAKEILPQAETGGIRGFLLQAFRCRCRKPVPDGGSSRQASKALQGTLATQFFPSAGNKTRLARLERQAVNRTQMILSGVKNVAIQDLHTGESIANSYVLEEQIGLGGMGVIYRARHRMLGRLCALKFLLPSAVTATSWEMFKKEAKILNELQHPAICRIFDMGLHKACLPFYAMEFLDGITLEELLNRKNTLGLGAALEIFIAVGDALTYAHRQKIIHKDVKPANIMLVQTTNGITVKLLDFGIAELSESDTTNESSEVAGSAAYMSPEQFTGQPLTPATDIYSLACSLFETLAGDTPFDGPNFEELSQQHQEFQAPTLKEFTGLDFPQEIEVVLDHALRKHPERRYRYMSEMTVDLQRILEGKPLQFARGERRRFPSSYENGRDDQMTFSNDDENEDEPYHHHHHSHRHLHEPEHTHRNARDDRGRPEGRGKGLLAGTALLSIFICVALYCFTGVGSSLNNLFGLKGPALTVASSQPKYFRLTKSDYEKLDLSEPYDSRSDYYLFPDDGGSRIGEVHLSSSDSGFLQLIPAAGLVKLPRKAARQALGLVLANDAINNLDLLAGFHNDELRYLTFPLTDMRHSPSEIHSFWGTAGQTYQLLFALRNWKSLRSIDFRSVTIDDQCVELLNTFPELEALSFSDGRLAREASLGKLRNLSGMQVLSLPPLEDASPVFERLADAKHLRVLELQNFVGSDKELVSLPCPNSLRKFGCIYSHVPIKLVEKLATSPHIEELDLAACYIPPEAAPIFLRMLWLKKLVLAEDVHKVWGEVRFEKFARQMRENGCLVKFFGQSATLSSAVTRLNVPLQKEQLLAPEQILEDFDLQSK